MSNLTCQINLNGDLKFVHRNQLRESKLADEYHANATLPITIKIEYQYYQYDLVKNWKTYEKLQKQLTYIILFYFFFYLFIYSSKQICYIIDPNIINKDFLPNLVNTSARAGDQNMFGRCICFFTFFMVSVCCVRCVLYSVYVCVWACNWAQRKNVVNIPSVQKKGQKEKKNSN